jgi:glutamate--cysteine ligase
MNHNPASEILSNVDQLVSIFSAAAKPKEKWLVGVEHEKLGVRSDGSPAPYLGPQGVAQLLANMLSDGWTGVYEGEHLIGASRNGEEVTLEPGMQVELSGPPLVSGQACATMLYNHVRAIRDSALPLGIRFIAGGFRPFGTLADVPWLPKRRYDIMREYLPRHGRLGHEMMKRTATVQVNLDFSSEQDAAEKIRTAAGLTSIVTALFAASPINEGRPTGWKSYRAAVWLDMDEDRCGLLPFVFDEGFGFRSYAEWALDVPMFFLARRGRYQPLEGVTFRRFFEQGLHGERATLDDWILHLSTVFPEVRLKRTIEMRGADAAILPFSVALPALWRGLLDDPEARAAAYALVADVGFADREALRREVPRAGLAARLRGRPIAPLAVEICEIAGAGLARLPWGREDRVLLEPLLDHARAGRCPADTMLADFQRLGGDPARLVEAWEITGAMTGAITGD